MKAILEFNLPEDQEEFNVASRGMGWGLVAWEMSSFFRNKLKYDHDIESVDAAFQVAQDHLYERMEHYGVSLEDFS